MNEIDTYVYNLIGKGRTFLDILVHTGIDEFEKYSFNDINDSVERLIENGLIEKDNGLELDEGFRLLSPTEIVRKRYDT